ncbi:alpha/beta hydrolase [Nocardioides daejeonensis]|uniref:alpha/beta hydrolase n=1 Tax=Nocardioides daejeonensis TaxID=1046556 RepID=UPI000D7483B9|nr:alpha/beta hydrolase [Nocardioides daejeonensis]
MALHPQARAAVAAQVGAPQVFDPGYDIAAEREAARSAERGREREHVREVRDLDAGGVPCRLYVPGERTDALVLHLHGGGFVFNDIEVHDRAVRAFANRLGVPVLSIDYRRPPEHRFPAAPDDVDAVVDWLRAGGLVGCGLAEEARLLVHGDSAGGNLALVAALRHPGAFAAVLLIYPFLDPEQGFDSYRTAADGFDPAEATWYWQQYAATPADLSDPDLAPLRSPVLGTLPPTLVVTAEHDPLRDEGEHLVHLLAEAGVEVLGTRVLGQVHGFWRHHDVFPVADPVQRQVAAFVGMVLERPGVTGSGPA